MNLKERTQLSRKLSYILRHNAQTLGIKIRTDGYVSLDELVNYLKVNINDINDVVDNDLKKRYTITTIDNNIYIRANQGHSMENIELNLKEIHSENELPICIHGTYSDKVLLIKKHGLSRMKRNHIHMATDFPECSDKVISGMRKSCDIIIWIDVEKTMKEGIKFFRSSNNVILSPGNDDGIIPANCFKYITNRNKELIDF